MIVMQNIFNKFQISSDISARMSTDPVLNVLSEIKESSMKKLIVDLLPLLSLNSHTSTLSMLGMLTFHVLDFKWRSEPLKSAQHLVGFVSYISFTIFFPKLITTSSSSFEIYKILTNQGTLFTKIFRIAHETIHIASVYWKTPSLKFASLVSQGVKEIYEAVENATRSPYKLAEVVNCIVGLARLYNALPYAKTVYTDNFLPLITKKRE